MEELIKKIAKSFDLIGTDGMMHIILSSIISVILSLVLPWWLVVPIVLFIGISKEFYDKQGHGSCEKKDIICDIIGILIGIL